MYDDLYIGVSSYKLFAVRKGAEGSAHWKDGSFRAGEIYAVLAQWDKRIISKLLRPLILSVKKKTHKTSRYHILKEGKSFKSETKFLSSTGFLFSCCFTLQDVADIKMM